MTSSGYQHSYSVARAARRPASWYSWSCAVMRCSCGGSRLLCELDTGCQGYIIFIIFWKKVKVYAAPRIMAQLVVRGAAVLLQCIPVVKFVGNIGLRCSCDATREPSSKFMLLCLIT